MTERELRKFFKLSAKVERLLNCRIWLVSEDEELVRSVKQAHEQKKFAVETDGVNDTSIESE